MFNKVNCFIVGAPKCGTTAMSEYLREHPQVFMSNPKEPYYFADDLPGIRKQAGFDCSLEQYETCFKTDDDNKKVFCDASVYYLYSSIAIENIKKYNKDAKIIVMLRNPMEMVYSYHSQLLYGFYENIKDFEKAWDLSEDRSNGLKIPKGCTDDKILDYKSIGLYSNQIERLYSIFDKKNIKVIIFDDFISNTEYVYRDVLEFLSIKDTNKIKFQIINENKAHRLPILTKISVILPENFIRIVSAVKRKLGIKKSIISFNIKKQSRKSLSACFKKVLSDYYKEDINKLEVILGIKLDIWKA